MGTTTDSITIETPVTYEGYVGIVGDTFAPLPDYPTDPSIYDAVLFVNVGSGTAKVVHTK